MSRNRIIGILLLLACGILFVLTNQQSVLLRAVGALLGVVGIALLLSGGARTSRASSSSDGGCEGTPWLHGDAGHGHDGGGHGGDGGGDGDGGH